jgi:hypothetical protein
VQVSIGVNRFDIFLLEHAERVLDISLSGIRAGIDVWENEIAKIDV